jgi:hypothetical protein
VPTRLELKNIGRSIVDHLKLRHPTGDAATRYNVLQSLAYLIVIFGLLPLVVIAGMAMSPRIDAVLHRLGRPARRPPVGALAALPGGARPGDLRRRPRRRGGDRRRLERDALDDHRLVPGARGPFEGERGVMSTKGYTLMRAKARDRRHLLRGAVAAAGAAVLAGCDRLSNNAGFVETLKSAQKLSHAAGRIVAPKSAMAQEFSAADVAPVFRGNGTLFPRDADYLALRKDGFAAYKLSIGGLVEKPLELSLEELRALPSRTQITRHDCVEGWSCIGKWKGTPLGALLDQARPTAEARFVVFRCFDSMEGPRSMAATRATTRASTSRRPTTRRRSSPTS